MSLTVHECTVLACWGQYPLEERHTLDARLALYVCIQLVLTV